MFPAPGTAPDRLQITISRPPMADPRLELINTGTELLLGRILNTHQQWLGRQLADHGWTLTRQVTVPDTGPAITEAVRDSLSRADIVITTGGLGPTSDDLTRDLIAQLLHRPLAEDEATLRAIQHYFASRQRPMPARTRVQALVPQGALVLHNPHGTAPGLALEVAPNPFRPDNASSWLIMLPGPPRELRPMFLDQVLPLLQRRCPPTDPFSCLTLRTTGIGESVVEERVGPLLQPLVQQGLELGYCARPGEVDVRIAARGTQHAVLLQSAASLVRSQLARHLYGTEDELLESAVVSLLHARHLTVATAESCTGGLVAHRLTNIPGASSVFLGGCVAYADEVKRALLGVSADLLARHGAVSEPVARAMAEGVRARFQATYGLALTGIAGPGGGTPAKPVGTLFIALASPTGTQTLQPFYPFDRETFKQMASQQALDLLRRAASHAAAAPAETTLPRP